jgi:hypothetical protein
LAKESRSRERRSDFFREDRRVSSKGAFRNLVCFNDEGDRVWVAELPSPGRDDVYYKISSRRPLVVNSFSSYACQINPKTDEIEGREFVK